jgi:D-amino-acid oxidase
MARLGPKPADRSGGCDCILRFDIRIAAMERRAILDTPDFFYDSATRPFFAARRPYREDTYRLEPDQTLVAGKLVVHNYGHGGAGITMSWGCALRVREIVSQHDTSHGVAVIGAGVMGMTVATLLREMNPPIAVTIYTDKVTPCTTSDVAGGQFQPSRVNYDKSSATAEKAFFTILRDARKEHERRSTPYGVSKRWNYTPVKLKYLDDLPVDIVPAATPLSHLPFARLTKPGWKYDILLIQPPILMPKLFNDLSNGGARFVIGKLKPGDLAQLPQPIIVNCTGLGARELVPDPKMRALQGQIVHLRAQPNLNYLFSGDGYVFPRDDCVVVGGTEEWIDNDTVNDAKCIKIVKDAKDLFDGKLFRFLTRSRWLISGK